MLRSCHNSRWDEGWRVRSGGLLIVLGMVLLLALAKLAAAQSGALTPLAGTDDCASEDGTGGECADGKALRLTSGVAVSRDGKHVYVTADDSGAAVLFTPCLALVSAHPGGA